MRHATLHFSTRLPSPYFLPTCLQVPANISEQLGKRKRNRWTWMEQKQRLGNVIHGFFATFHYFNGVFGCLLFIYFMPLHDHHFFTFSSWAFCSTVSRDLTARAPTHHPIRHAMQRGARGGHPSLGRFWPRAFHVCPLSIVAMILVPDPLLSVLFTAHYPLLPGRIQNAVPQQSWVGFSKLNGKESAAT